MSLKFKFLHLALGLGSLFCNTSILNAQPIVSYGVPVVTGLNNPVDVVNAGDSRLFIVQQNGLIRSWDGTSLSNFLDLSAVPNLFPTPLGGEQGLLSLAFDPGFALNRYFFIWYTGSTGAVTLARYRANVGNLTGDPSTGQVLLSVEKPNQPSYYTNHNGGKLNFGADGMLYIGTGDGGSGGDPFNNAQNPASLLGKMLRLDVSGFNTSAPFYNIPSDNPFLAPGDGVADEIYSLGLRNPWRWSFDRADGNMWIADVGQDAWEEVNYIPAGSTSGLNYGWRCREGRHDYNTSGCTGGYTEPIFDYPHNNATGGFSITGGYVYRGPDASNAALLGSYVTADFVSGNFWIVQSNGNATIQTGLPASVVSFGEANDGTLYVLRRLAAPNGALYKLQVTSVVPVVLKSFTASSFPGYNQLNWVTASETNSQKFLLQFSMDNINFRNAGEVAANGFANGSSYSFRHNIVIITPTFYRLKLIDKDGSSRYSPTVKVGLPTAEAISIYPTSITNGTINIYMAKPGGYVRIFAVDGRQVYYKQLPGSGTMQCDLAGFVKGIYVVEVTSQGVDKKERIFVQ